MHSYSKNVASDSRIETLVKPGHTSSQPFVAMDEIASRRCHISE
jgi:hypothetical protein